MNQGWENICPVCGNYMQSGSCPRCYAISSTRAKRWRRGDRGGVRPERRIVNNRSVPLAPAPRRPKHKKLVNQTGSTLFLALQGDWYSSQKRIKISIDLTRKRWTFTLATGKRITQIWKLKSKSRNEISFTRRGLEIIARPGKDGVLMLTGRKGPVPFFFVIGEQTYRLCSACFYKSEWHYERCKDCGRSF